VLSLVGEVFQWTGGFSAYPGNRILVTGSTGTGACIVRLHADGGLDESFGNGGVMIVDSGPRGDFYTPHVQADGTILVSGWSELGTTIRRYQVGGAPDPGFGTGGVVAFDVPNGAMSSLSLLPDGRIAIAGTINFFQEKDDAAVWMLRPDGTPDLEFGTQGAWLAPTTNEMEILYRVLPAADGSLYLVVTVFEWDEFNGFGARDLDLVHLDAHGVPDPAFGTNGTVRHYQAFVESWLTAISPDHRIVLAGDVDWDGRLMRFWY
jgi:uncharacterized delta-60 repeat protein